MKSQFSNFFREGPKPFSPEECFREDGWHVWCGSLLKDPDVEQYHLFYSRWPVSEGYDAWVTHSEIAHAIGYSPKGPFTFVERLWPRDRNSQLWDAHCFHNVTVKSFEGRYYLYYMGNAGNGEWWTHRNNQRIGVAIADHPNGPWIRQKTPALDVSPGAWDSLMVSNPTITDTSDGRFMMIYKGVGEGKPPFGGRVLHGLAWANTPEGPFTKYPTPIFDFDETDFAFEDPYLWREDNEYFCLVKDMQGTLSPSRETSVVLLQSENGTDWSPSDPPLVLSRTLQSTDGRSIAFERVERPNLFIQPDEPPVLTVAVQPKDPGEASFNIRLHYDHGV
ncbi:glycoside hydrolase family protein [Puniceicoccus vermicola]|uniref:Sucrase n=1 Tax=Puniceicoccus vermicola TaxID=388746 RepID=A0A7X1E475_9BACT|nr:glycoside hydrolase family protein [Puniceicoccus vermicola]MBC2601744.1 sucrase [Puniceicoccus vermicola]